MVALEGKDPALSLLWYRFHLRLGNFLMLWVRPKKNRKRERNQKRQPTLSSSYSATLSTGRNNLAS